MHNADNERQREAIATVKLACDNRGRCWDCGRSYGNEHGFPDLIVSDDVWAKISPTGHEGGLLCPSCICRRAFEAGVEDAEAHFTSGPFAELHWRRPECGKGGGTATAVRQGLEGSRQSEPAHPVSSTIPPRCMRDGCYNNADAGGVFCSDECAEKDLP